MEIKSSMSSSSSLISQVSRGLCVRLCKAPPDPVARPRTVEGRIPVVLHFLLSPIQSYINIYMDFTCIFYKNATYIFTRNFYLQFHVMSLGKSLTANSTSLIGTELFRLSVLFLNEFQYLSLKNFDHFTLLFNLLA